MDLVQKRKRNATDILKPEGKRDTVAELIMENLNISGQTTFRANSALNRGQLKGQGAGRVSTHFCADEAAIFETIFHTIISVNQRSIFGAVADLCDEFGQTLIDSERTHVVMEPSESMVALL